MKLEFEKVIQVILLTSIEQGLCGSHISRVITKNVPAFSQVLGYDAPSRTLHTCLGILWCFSNPPQMELPFGGLNSCHLTLLIAILAWYPVPATS